MLGLPMSPRLAGAPLVTRFGQLDTALPWPDQYAGGGARQRRRIQGAVGPERTNIFVHNRDLTQAAWQTDVGTCPVTPAGDGFDLAFSGAGANKFQAVPVTAGALYTVSFELSVAAGTASFEIGGINAGSYETVVVTTTRQWYSVTQAASGATRYPVIKALGAGTVRVWDAQCEPGIARSPSIVTGASPVTTTDWLRTNYANHGSTPLVGAGWTTDGLAQLVEAPLIVGPTGMPMSKLSQASGGTYAYSYVDLHGGNTAAEGRRVGYRFCAHDGGRANKHVRGSLLQYPGAVVIAMVELDLASGEYTESTPGTVKSLTKYGDVWCVEMEGTTAQTSELLINIQLQGDEDGTGHYFGTLHAGPAPLGAIIDNENVGHRTVVSPPYGELVTVDAGDPRIQYDKHGIGIGVVVERGSANLLSYSQPKGSASVVNGWVPNGAGGNWIDNAVRGPGGGLTATFVPTPVGGGTKFQLAGPVVAGQKYTATWRVQSLGGTYYQCHVDSTGVSPSASIAFYFADGSFGPPSATVSEGYMAEPLEDGWWEVSMPFVATANGNVAVHAFESNGDIAVADMQLEAGGKTSLMPTDGSGGVSSDESITCANLAALGLDGDEWTVIVTAQEPAADPTPGCPMLLSMFGAGGASMNINRQPAGHIAIEAYDGAVQRQVQVAGGTAGAFRRFAIGFSRAAGILRGGATGESVVETAHSNLTAFPMLTSMRLGSGNNAWHIGGIVAERKSWPRLLSAAEMAKELTL